MGLVLVLELVVELVGVQKLEALVEEGMVLLCSEYYSKVDFLRC